MTQSSLQVELFCLVKRQPSPATMWLCALQLLRSHSELFSRRPSTDEPWFDFQLPVVPLGHSRESGTFDSDTAKDHSFCRSLNSGPDKVATPCFYSCRALQVRFIFSRSGLSQLRAPCLVWMFRGTFFQQCRIGAGSVCCKKWDNPSKRAEFAHSQPMGRLFSIALCSDAKAPLVITLAFDSLPLTSRPNLRTQSAL